MYILLSGVRRNGSLSLSVSFKNQNSDWHGGKWKWMAGTVGGGWGAVAVHMPCLLILPSRCHHFSEKVLPNYDLHVFQAVRVLKMAQRRAKSVKHITCDMLEGNKYDKRRLKKCTAAEI